ncbi:UNVERIFIED_CONTAM: 5-dehydro-2-deoxygluconokinase [Sesamum radiatum]|uniref:5-dehydro-2-deoxygluconokinase n=1 Tax=Sesamum radiatum TaxID=300843 RepID=A0AAW2SHM8_SESRA
MGIEIQPNINNRENDSTVVFAAAAPVILGLQPSALDHALESIGPSSPESLASLAAPSLSDNDEVGILLVAVEELNLILDEVNTHFLASPETSSPLKTNAGGSVANTIRGLAAGFGVTCGIIGACGDDDQGCLFVDNMSSYKVNLSRLRLKSGPTAQCVCLVDELGNRTMRPCLSGAVKVQADELTTADLQGSKWLVLRYAIFNIEVIQAAITLAKQEGVSVSLDLASFEMVREFRLPLLQLLESGCVDLCFANEDEAAELLGGEDNADSESALEFLANHCQWAVVTLGSKGCIAKHGKEVVRVPAIGEAVALDATGAGDLFASGFLYGLVNGLSLEDCCRIGSCSGGSVIRSLGGEVTPENWQWMYKQMQIKGLKIPEPQYGVRDYWSSWRY